MTALERIGPLLGRVLLAVIFVFSGAGKLLAFEGTVAHIASAGLPMPQLAAAAAIVVELGGGLLLVIGWQARWAALALIVFTGLATVLFHNFWAVAPEQAQMQLIQFMKNLSILGGLLYVASYGGGPLGADRD